MGRWPTPLRQVCEVGAPSGAGSGQRPSRLGFISQTGRAGAGPLAWAAAQAADHRPISVFRGRWRGGNRVIPKWICGEAKPGSYKPSAPGPPPADPEWPGAHHWGGSRTWKPMLLRQHNFNQRQGWGPLGTGPPCPDTPAPPHAPCAGPGLGLHVGAAYAHCPKPMAWSLGYSGPVGGAAVCM